MVDVVVVEVDDVVIGEVLDVDDTAGAPPESPQAAATTMRQPTSQPIALPRPITTPADISTFAPGGGSWIGPFGRSARSMERLEAAFHHGASPNGSQQAAQNDLHKNMRQLPDSPRSGKWSGWAPPTEVGRRRPYCSP